MAPLPAVLHTYALLKLDTFTCTYARLHTSTNTYGGLQYCTPACAHLTLRSCNT